MGIEVRNATRIALIALFVSLGAESAQAGIINVPGDQPTIQAGIDAAVDGDEVVLADGIYTGAGNVNCTFDKLITVRSASGNPEACIIDCQNVAGTRGFTFAAGLSNAATLSGITIRNGNTVSPSAAGGAVLVSASSSATMTNCRFLANNAATAGGGVHVESGASITLMRCDFIENTAGTGGAVRTSGGPTAIRSCRFVGNSANLSGGAIAMLDNALILTACSTTTAPTATSQATAARSGCSAAAMTFRS